MKIGDLVKVSKGKEMMAGIVTEIVQKKYWRIGEDGHYLGNFIETEPHAVILVGEKFVTIPVRDLEVVGG